MFPATFFRCAARTLRFAAKILRSRNPNVCCQNPVLRFVAERQFPTVGGNRNFRRAARILPRAAGLQTPTVRRDSNLLPRGEKAPPCGVNSSFHHAAESNPRGGNALRRRAAHRETAAVQWESFAMRRDSKFPSRPGVFRSSVGLLRRAAGIQACAMRQGPPAVQWESSTVGQGFKLQTLRGGNPTFHCVAGIRRYAVDS